MYVDARDNWGVDMEKVASHEKHILQEKQKTVTIMILLAQI